MQALFSQPLAQVVKPHVPEFEQILRLLPLQSFVPAVHSVWPKGVVMVPPMFLQTPAQPQLGVQGVVQLP